MSTSANTRCALAASLIEDLKLAGAKMLGEARRAFYAAMTVKHCGGNPRQAETVLGWNRHTVVLGLQEQRTGIICLGAYQACCGNKRWEERYPDAAQKLWRVAQIHSQQDPSFRTTLSYTRLTAAEALQQLRDLGVSDDELPAPSTMADVLNRNGYRLRPVLKAKPQKKFQKQTPSLPTFVTKTEGRQMAESSSA
jgi:hypothetical protein